MDRVLGGGIVPGSLVLLAGEPGVGKSTLMLQIAGFVAGNACKILYASGEESDRQIKLRSNRLGLLGSGIYLLAETDVDRIIEELEQALPNLVIVDSIQTLFTSEASSGPGSIAQVRECTLRLMRWAKTRGVPIILSSHVTKDGTLAGPRVMEHMVDVVLYFEGDNLGDNRVLRSVKNRFGSTNEVAMFQMEKSGLEEVLDPSQTLLEQRMVGSVGSVVTPMIEGSRSLLIEIQALTSRSFLPVPRRTANGVDYNRMMMIIAVLGRRTRLGLSNQDIIANITGGVRTMEPGVDLALALSIASSLLNRPVKTGLVAIGEVGLSGELRSATQMDRRLAESARLGFSTCVLPPSSKGHFTETFGLDLSYVSTLAQAIHVSLGDTVKDETNVERYIPVSTDP